MKQPEQSQEYCKLLYDAYYGEGGFLDGMYIDRHKREADDNYNNRRKWAFYRNYIQPVVDSHVNGVFNHKPERSYNEGGLIEGFIPDCTGSKVSIDDFMKDTASIASLQGCTLVIVDNDIYHPEDLKTTIETRSFPYVYTIDREQITDYKVDKSGNLIMIQYEFMIEHPVTGKPVKQRKTWATDFIILEEQQSVSGTGQIKWIEIDRFENTIGVLPCKFLYHSSDLKGQVLPTSKFLQAAKINRSIYNMDSEIREIERQFAFPILTIQGEPNENTKIGVHNALYYSKDVSNKPEFISMPDTPVKILSDHSDRLVQEIYRIACVAYTQQFANNMQSGESKKWTFHITRQVLESFANNCETLENWIGYIFDLYTGQNSEYNVSYSRNYGADDIDVDSITTQTALDIGIGGRFDVEVKKKYARQFFSDQDEALIKEIEADIQNEYEAKQSDSVDDSNADDLNKDKEIDPLTGKPIEDTNTDKGA